jgi:hypothetical protein
MKKGKLIGLFFLSDLVAVGLFGFGLTQQQENGDLFSNPILLAAMGLFILTPIVLLIVYSLSSHASDAELLRSGILAYATVLDVRDLRSGMKDSPAQVALKLQVNPPNAAFYEASANAPISGLNPTQYFAGMTIKVRYDPRHPKRVVVDDGSASQGAAAVAGESIKNSPAFSTQANIPFSQITESRGGQLNLLDLFSNQTSIQVNSPEIGNLPPAIQKVIQAALVDADHNGIPDVAEKGGMNSSNVQVIDLSERLGSVSNPQARIEKLEKLRAAGIISQEQFDMLRNLIDKGTQKGAGNEHD